MTFRFQSLILEQFRCFEHLSLTLEPDLTLLFAENGGGKTSILHALAVGMTAFQTGVPRVLKLDAQRDVRKIAVGDRNRREAAGGCELTWTATVGAEQGVSWSNRVQPCAQRTILGSNGGLERDREDPRAWRSVAAFCVLRRESNGA
jgi:predicted ATP-binding protein involved in virulence